MQGQVLGIGNGAIGHLRLGAHIHQMNLALVRLDHIR